MCNFSVKKKSDTFYYHLLLQNNQRTRHVFLWKWFLNEVFVEQSIGDYFYLAIAISSIKTQFPTYRGHMYIVLYNQCSIVIQRSWKVGVRSNIWFYNYIPIKYFFYEVSLSKLRSAVIFSNFSKPIKY